MKSTIKSKAIIASAITLSIALVLLFMINKPKEAPLKEIEGYRLITTEQLAHCIEKEISLYLNDDKNRVMVDSNDTLVFIINETSYQMDFDEFVLSLNQKDFTYDAYVITKEEREEIITEIIEKEESKAGDVATKDPTVSNQPKPSIPKPSVPTPEIPTPEVPKPGTPTPDPKPEPPITPPVKPNDKTEWVVVSKETIYPKFQIVKIENPDLYDDKKIQNGRYGESTVTTTCFSTNGVVDKSNCKETIVVVEPVQDEIWHIGTKPIVYTETRSTNAENNEMLRIVNAHRADNGLHPLEWFTKGNSAGLKRTTDLNNLVKSGKDINHNGSIYSENISKTGGKASPLITFNQYKNSPSHNKAMLDKYFTKMSSHSIYRINSLGGGYTVNVMQFE